MQCIEIPTEATAGLTFRASVNDDLHAAPDWSLSLHLRGPAAIDLMADSDGGEHSFTVPASETAAWAPGRYWWAIRATNGADVEEIERGDVAIAPDMLAAPSFDGRSDAEKAFEAINAVLGKRATIDQERYRINNRELYRMSVSDLLKLRTFYAAQVRKERNRKSGSRDWGRAVHVRFS